MPTYDVVISGAGPVGLFLACELALAKCSVLVLEKAADPHSPLKQLPFGMRGLSAPTIEAMHRRGLLDELELHKRIKNPHKTTATEGPQRMRGHFAGIPFLEGNIDASQWPYRLPSSTETSLMTDMAEMEKVLSRRAEALGVETRRGTAIASYQQDADGVTVQTESEESLAAKWLVGCDGSRSIVRKLGGFDFAGTEPEFTGYSAQVELADPEKLKPGRNLTATGMYLQSQPGYIIMVEFDGGAGHTGEAITREQVEQVLRRVSETDVTITALRTATTWTDRARQATHYRNGRVLLAGDAAHIHAPLGGQGLNLGIGDAMNLGWKLAATVHGKAPDDLLDTYEAERHPLGVRVLDWSRAQVAIMKPDPAARALNAVFRDVIDTRDGATYFAGRVWGVDTRYDSAGAHSMVGRSVPNFQFTDGSTIGEHMRDGRGLLLNFGANTKLAACAANFGEQMKYFSAQSNERFGLSAALIRPDGYIAWASNDECKTSGLDRAASRWFSAEAA